MPLMAILVALEVPATDRPWRTALDAGNYPIAWALAQEEPEALERYRATATILYRAGDPAGALAASKAGLDLQADHLELLHHAAAAAIWLEKSTPALEYSVRLLKAVDSDQSAGVLPADRAAWRSIALNFQELSRALASSADSRRRSVERCQVISMTGLGAAAVLVGLLALRYGRSSRPVS